MFDMYKSVVDALPYVLTYTHTHWFWDSRPRRQKELEVNYKLCLLVGFIIVIRYT